MSTRKNDPIAKRPDQARPDRVAYAQGVMLDADDFHAEQGYHRGRLARALKYVVGYGTVAGLGVSHRAESGDDPEQIRVAPGMALDRLGRIIEVPRLACIRLQRWWDALVTNPDGTPNFTGRDVLRQGWYDAVGGRPSGVLADIFIRFTICERGLTPAFATGPYDALDAVQPSRLRDGYELSFIVRDDDPGEPINPYTQYDAVIAGGNVASRAIDAIIGSWQDGTDTTPGWDRESDRYQPLPIHHSDADPTSVLVARVLIPADNAVDADSAPTRRAEPPEIYNAIRHIVMAPGLFQRWPGGV